MQCKSVMNGRQCELEEGHDGRHMASWGAEVETCGISSCMLPKGHEGLHKVWQLEPEGMKYCNHCQGYWPPHASNFSRCAMCFYEFGSPCDHPEKDVEPRFNSFNPEKEHG
jgi:hypothetical protein